MFLYQKLGYKVTCIDSLEKVSQLIVNFPEQHSLYMAYDTETTGLNIIKDYPFLCTFGYDKELFYFTDFSYVELLYEFARNFKWLFAHNAKYDWHMMYNKGCPVPEDIHLAESKAVARLTSYVDEEDEGFALEDLGIKYVDKTAKFAGKVIKNRLKDIKQHRLQAAKKLFKEKYPKIKITPIFDAYYDRIQFVKTEYDEYFEFIDSVYKAPNYYDVYLENPDLMVSYALDDIVILLEYLKKSLPILEKVDDNFNVFEQENKLIRVVGDMENQGFKVDVDYLLKARENVYQYQQKLYNRLQELTGEKFTSGQHAVIKKVFKRMGNLDLSNVDKKVISGIISEHKGTPIGEVAKCIKRLRTVDKWLSTYIEGMLNRIVNGRVHSEIDNEGTVTGRVSSDLQQQPKEAITDDDGNEIFHPRRVMINDENSTLYFMDFMSMELRVQADYTVQVSGGDHNLCSAFMPFDLKSMFTGETFDYHNLEHEWDSGEWVDEYGKLWKDVDLHSLTTKKAFPQIAHLDKGNPEFDHYRRLGKRANFLKVYAGGVQALMDSLEIDEATANALNKGFYEAYPQILKYQKWVDRILTNQGYAENLFGRKYFVQSRSIYYKIYNYLIQGSCADIVKDKEIRIHELLKNHKSKLVYPVHDELIFKIIHGEEFLVEQIRAIMNDNRKYLNNVPLICDVEVSKVNWADKEAYV